MGQARAKQEQGAKTAALGEPIVLSPQSRARLNGLYAGLIGASQVAQQITQTAQHLVEQAKQEYIGARDALFEAHGLTLSDDWVIDFVLGTVYKKAPAAPPEPETPAE